MHDPLLEEDPWVLEFAARREVQAEARGEAKGEIKNMRESIELFVQMRFPNLIDLARERVQRAENLILLQRIQASLYVAPDENNARSVLLSVPVENSQGETTHV